MTNSYQGTEFNVVGRPVNTFVQPTTQVEQKKTGFDIVAESLATLNPALQKTLGSYSRSDKRRKTCRF